MSPPGVRFTREPPPRMAALTVLPIFLALDGKRVVIAGENAAVAWKAELLSAAGAEVEVFAERPCDELRAVASQPPRGDILLRERVWQAADLRSAVLAVGGFEDEEEARRFCAAARLAGVAVNVIDRPAVCDFAFGAIINRSPLVIGISTDGAAPVLAQAIRTKLETLFPRGFARWAQAAQCWRERVQSSPLPVAARRRFWQHFARVALSEPERDPTPIDFDALMKTARSNEAASVGALTLIIVSSRDPELLTLRALRALQSADVVLSDDEVAPDIVDFARREARKMLVGARGDAERDPISFAIALAKAGNRVVWLSGAALALTTYASALSAAGIAVETVPCAGGAARMEPQARLRV